MGAGSRLYPYLFSTWMIRNTWQFCGRKESRHHRREIDHCCIAPASNGAASGSLYSPMSSDTLIV